MLNALVSLLFEIIDLVAGEAYALNGSRDVLFFQGQDFLEIALLALHIILDEHSLLIFFAIARSCKIQLFE